MCYYYCKNCHYWRNCSARNTSGGFHNTQSSQACSDKWHLYSPLEVLPLPRVQSQDNNELYSNLVESVVNIRQLEVEFVDSGHVDKSEGLWGRIAKSIMWWFENLIMSLTVIEVLSDRYKLPFVQIPDSRFIPNSNIVHYTKMNLEVVNGPLKNEKSRQILPKSRNLVQPNTRFFFYKNKLYKNTQA